MSKRLTAGIGTLLIGVLLTGAAAQNAYFGYVEEPVQPRSAAMGGVGTARSSGGFSFYNPSGPASFGNSFVSFEYGQQWSDLTRGMVEFSWLLPRWFFGTSFQTQGVSFSITDEFGSEILPGEGMEQASQLSLCAGWRNKRFAFAVAANGLQHHLYDVDAFALSASGGISVAVVPEKLTAGAAILHAGRLHRGFYENRFTAHRDSMPTTARIGACWDDTLFRKVPVTLQVDAVYSSNYSRVMVPVGIEIRPIAPIAVRIGKRFNHLTDLFSCGIGVSWANMSYDLALIPTNIESDMGLKWSLGLTYALAKRKPAAEKTGIAPPADTDTTSGKLPADTIPPPSDKPSALSETPDSAAVSSDGATPAAPETAPAPADPIAPLPDGDVPPADSLSETPEKSSAAEPQPATVPPPAAPEAPADTTAVVPETGTQPPAAGQ